MLRSAGAATVPRFSVDWEASFRVPFGATASTQTDTEFAEISREVRVVDRQVQIGGGLAPPVLLTAMYSLPIGSAAGPLQGAAGRDVEYAGGSAAAPEVDGIGVDCFSLVPAQSAPGVADS